MISFGADNQATFYNKHYTNPKKLSIEVEVSPVGSDKMFDNLPNDTISDFEFKICYHDLEINPLDAIADPDSKPVDCLSPIVIGEAGIKVDGSITGMIYEDFNKFSKQDQKAIIIGAKLVHNNLKQFDKHLMKKQYY